MARAITGLVTIAIPCRADEPAVGQTLADAWASWRAVDPSGAGLEILVCLNGVSKEIPAALVQIEAFAREVGAALERVDVDATVPASAGAPVSGVRVTVLETRRAGKAAAWNHLRRRAAGARIVFCDADVRIPLDSIGLLLGALAARPEAILAAGRTRCVVPATAFGRIVAVPYGVEFPNLSPQLYAARSGLLPPAMPDGLLDPERWLELVVGSERIVRAPSARVLVRVPLGARDFVRQRVRIHLGRLQIDAAYPGLGGRAAAQPGFRVALASLAPSDVLRLTVYLGLRTGAHLLARLRFRTGRLDGAWAQPRSTKTWSDS